MGPIHKKLHGTWKSDKRRTLATCKFYDNLPLARKRKFGSIFGKLQMRYTPQFYYMTIDGETYRERYEVISEDSESIVLMTYMDAMRKKVDPIILDGCEELFAPSLSHLHLETIRGREYYWIGLRTMTEWFRKVG